MLKVGIVGLPNAGKSTLFNALVKGNQAEVANYPFCTIEPNVGVVQVPDERLAQLAALVKPEKIIPAAIEFVDIAGLVAGAHQGEGLGNKFLSHIKKADAIVLVLRAFSDPNVSHVHGAIDPISDYETLMLELTMCDLATVTNAWEKSKDSELLRIKDSLEHNQPVDELFIKQEPTDTESQLARELQLLTAKRRLLVFNIDEEKVVANKRERAAYPGFTEDNLLFICSKLESELINLAPTEQTDYLKGFGLTEPGLHRLIHQAYQMLGLCSFFTAGPQEVRAWTIQVGATAPEAAGVIHTDFQQKFIKAEVISLADYLKFGGEVGAKEAGHLRSEGKTYQVQDGDVIYFRAGQ